MADAKEVAAGLTKAQQEALCQCEAWSGHTRKALIMAGLAKRGPTDFCKTTRWSSPRYPFELTDFGLEVRAILAGEKSDA